MPILTQINDVLNSNPIFRHGTDEVSYYVGDGWDMLVSTYIGKPGRHLVTPRTTLESRPTATLYVSIGSTIQGMPLEFDSPGVHVRLGQTFLVYTRNGPLALSSPGPYREHLHGRWTVTAHRGMLLRLQGITN